MNWIQLQTELSRHLLGQPFTFEIIDVHFHDRWLSPVRHQGDSGACTFVACVSYIEMIYREETSGKGNADPIAKYFDLNEMFDNIFKLSGDKHQLLDKTGCKFGAHVSQVLSYIVFHGLVRDSECRNPRTRNLHSYYCSEVPRTRLFSYRMLDPSEVLAIASHSPIIVVVYAYPSLKNYQKLIYGGPSAEELARAQDPTNPCIPHGHAVLIVGRLSLRVDKGTSELLIIQDSQGESSGFNGFLIVPFNVGNTFFIEFWSAERDPISHKRCFVDQRGHQQINEKPLERHTCESMDVGALEDVEMQTCDSPNAKA